MIWAVLTGTAATFIAAYVSYKTWTEWIPVYREKEACYYHEYHTLILASGPLWVSVCLINKYFHCYKKYWKIEPT